MNLHELIEGFVNLGYASVGFGPRHPDMPVHKLQSEIEAFFTRYPSLQSDQGYVDFLLTYSAASIDWPDERLVMEIYGFSDFTTSLPHPDEPLIDENGFFRFAEIQIGPILEDNTVGIEFAWDITGERRDGIYRRILTMADYDRDAWKYITYTWYCGDFLEWLEDVVNKQGKLL
jgi:hypothetical protein